MNKIIIFASGNGSNAENIAKYFTRSNIARVDLILSNKADAYVLQRAQKLGIPSVSFNRTDLYHSNKILNLIKSHSPDLIVLAGFLCLLPSSIIEAFPKRIINIHPALLPKFGGKGMYGERVHKAVLDAGEKESGISIHLVNEKFDEGTILFQRKCIIDEGDSIEQLAEKVHKLEYKHFPEFIDFYLRDLQD